MKENWLSLLNRFFFGNQVYSSDDSISQNFHFSQEAIVDEAISPGRRGRVRCGDSFWPARCTQPITLMPNTLVKVRGHDNITLLVEPIYPLVPAVFQKNAHEVMLSEGRLVVLTPGEEDL